MVVRPTFSLQLGDRVKIVDLNTDLDDDFLVVQLEHLISAAIDSAEAQTNLTLIKIP